MKKGLCICLCGLFLLFTGCGEKRAAIDTVSSCLSVASSRTEEESSAIPSSTPAVSSQSAPSSQAVSARPKTTKPVSSAASTAVQTKTYPSAFPNGNNTFWQDQTKTHMYVVCDAGTLYFYDSKAIRTCRLDTKTVGTPIVTADIKAMDVYNDWIYYITQSNELWKVKTDGSGAFKLYTADFTASLKAVRNNLYFFVKTELSQSAKDQAARLGLPGNGQDFYRINLDDGAVIKIGSRTTLSGYLYGQFLYSSLNIDDDYIYTSNGKKIVRYDLEGKNQTVLFEDTQNRINRVVGALPIICTAGNYIFFSGAVPPATNYDQNAVFRINKDGSGITVYVQGVQRSVSYMSFFASGSFLFVYGYKYSIDMTNHELNADWEDIHYYGGGGDVPACEYNNAVYVVCFDNSSNPTAFQIRKGLPQKISFDTMASGNLAIEDVASGTPGV